MSDAFVYMFVVGAGTSSGVAVVGLVTYRIFMYMQGKGKSKKRRGVV